MEYISILCYNREVKYEEKTFVQTKMPPEDDKKFEKNVREILVITNDYSDDDMFRGHHIQVPGTIEDGIESADMVG